MKKDTLTSKERVRLALSLQEADRIPRFEHLWPECMDYWKQTGMPDNTDVAKLFKWDIKGAGWVNCQGNVDYSEVVEETDRWIAKRDGNKAVLKYWKHKSGTPEHVAFGVDTQDKWNELKKEIADVPIARRVDLDNALLEMKNARENNLWFTWLGLEAFEATHYTIGHETLCIIALEEPEWLNDIFETETDINIAGLNYLEQNGVKFDSGFIYGDLAYTNGSFLSPKLYQELLMPHHKRHIDWFKERGMPVIWHSCGNVKKVLPDLIEAGITCIQPMEAKVGNDVREYKELYGDKLAFMGNIDITVCLTNDKEKIEAEMGPKITAAKKGGGYIYHSDHSIPPGVDWDTYCFMMEMVDKYGQY